MNTENFNDPFDHESEQVRAASLKACLKKISVAMACLDHAGEDIAVAHLQAGLDVLSGPLFTEAASSRDILFH